MDFEPRADDVLCFSVQHGSLFDIQQAVNSLGEDDRPILLSRAMIISISERNIPAFLLLLRYGELEEEVVEAVVASGSIELVQVILQHGWLLDQPLRGGSIPSILSLATRNADLLASLIALGADPNRVSNLGETALSFAIRQGTMKTVRILLASADVTQGDLLHCACRREQSEDTYELIAMLVRKGVPIDAYQWDNERARMMRYGFPQRTALHIACKQNNYLAAKALLEFGANPRRLQKTEECYEPPSPYDLTKPGSNIRILLEQYMRC